jgi:hypothetical protein
MHKQVPNASAFMLSSFRKKYFMLDPNFPERLLEAGDKRTIEFIQFLSTEYSKRGLTEETDRCAAISGLESRIAQVKKCETRFGIFQSFLHRSLLWQRSEERDTDRIDYGPRIVPSWSWMAYNGSIEFTDIPWGEVEWVCGLRFNNKPNEQSGFDEEWKSALVTDVGSFRRCNFKRRGTGCAILDLDRPDGADGADGAERGWIEYDMETHERLDAERCVVLGRDFFESAAGKRNYYILVVRPTGIENEYTRVGAGCIQSDYVARQGVQALIV